MGCISGPLIGTAGQTPHSHAAQRPKGKRREATLEQTQIFITLRPTGDPIGRGDKVRGMGTLNTRRGRGTESLTCTHGITGELTGRMLEMLDDY
jgi:hypothetical protein